MIIGPLWPADDAAAMLAQLCAVSATLPVGMVIAEAPSGRVRHGNAAALRCLPRSWVPTPSAARYANAGWLHPDGRPLAAAEYPLARAIAGQTVQGVTVQVDRDDGAVGWLRISARPVYDASGQIVFAIATMEDLASERYERSLLEQTVALRTAALRRSETRTRTLFEHAPLDILVLRAEPSGAVMVEECNPAFCRTTGLSPEGVVGRDLATALGDTGAALADDCRKCLALGGYESQRTLMFPAGARVIHGYYRPVPNDEGCGPRVMLMQVDLTESRRVEAALQQATRLEAIGQVTGGVAHEFNNLLTAVLGSLDLLSRRLMDERQLRWVATAASAARRGATLTNQLLAYARKQFMAPAATDIPESLGTMMELMRGSLGARIALTTAFAADTWPALADPAQLQLTVMNLLLNARDAMPEGGKVMLSTQNRPEGHPDLPSELERRDYVELTVADCGAGMSPDVLRQAMEPFFTTKGFGQGTGLGLSQAYGVARQLGGTIRLHSIPGQGVTAQIFLPRAGAAHSLEAVSLLLVDDDEDVRASAAALLRDEGWDVVEAASGEEALRALAGRSFAALLVDLAMPRMSGTELAEAARAQRPGLPVVFLTGNADLDLLRSLPGPALSKPYSSAALLAAIQTALQGDGPATGGR